MSFLDKRAIISLMEDVRDDLDKEEVDYDTETYEIFVARMTVKLRQAEEGLENVFRTNT